MWLYVEMSHVYLRLHLDLKPCVFLFGPQSSLVRQEMVALPFGGSENRGVVWLMTCSKGHGWSRASARVQGLKLPHLTQCYLSYTRICQVVKPVTITGIDHFSVCLSFQQPLRR